MFNCFYCAITLFRDQHTKYPTLCLKRNTIIAAAKTLYAILAILAGFLHYASEDQMLNPCKHCILISECQPQLCKCLTVNFFTRPSCILKK